MRDQKSIYLLLLLSLSLSALLLLPLVLSSSVLLLLLLLLSLVLLSLQLAYINIIIKLIIMLIINNYNRIFRYMEIDGYNNNNNFLLFFYFLPIFFQMDMNPVCVGPDSPYIYKDGIFFSGHKFIGGPGTVKY